MTTPNKQAIIEKALELWQKDQYRNGHSELAETTPEPSELLEDGYLSLAQNMLMQEGNQNKAYAEQFSDLTISRPTQPQPILKPQPIPFSIEDAKRSGVFIAGTRQCGKTTLAQWQTNQLISSGFIVYVLDPTRAWQTRRSDFEVTPVLPKSHVNNSISWRFRNTIFDMSRTHIDEYVEFAELFSGTLFDTVTTRSIEPQIFVWYEEAHTPMPNFSFFSKRLRETKRLITQGANFNISFGAITQFAALIDKLPVKATQQRYFGLTSEPNDLNYIGKFIGKEEAKTLCTLQTGEFVYNSKGMTKRFRTSTATQKYENHNQHSNLISSYTYGAN